MKISKPKLVLNPYEWLPGYGESKVSFRSVALDVFLEIEYEREVLDDCGDESYLTIRREILFKSVYSFMKFPFPGRYFFDFEGDSNEFKLGNLTEFTQSDWVEYSKRAYYSSFGRIPLRMRHFSIQFMSENVAFDILAEEVILSSEFPNHQAQ